MSEQPTAIEGLVEPLLRYHETGGHEGDGSDERIALIRAALQSPAPVQGWGPCELCAGECRGHSLGHDDQWEPEEGSRAWYEAELARLRTVQGDRGELIERFAAIQCYAVHPRYYSITGDIRDAILDALTADAALIESLQERVDELTEGLKPFAAKAEYADALELADSDGVECAPIDAGHYRRARSLLKEQG